MYSDTIPGISFDSEMVCNFCHQVETLKQKYGTGEARGVGRWEEIADQIRTAMEGRRYGCVVGVSGGTDSSYLVSLASEMGLRPLAAHYDNTWNSSTATLNISRVLAGLEVDLVTHVVDNREADDIFRSFFLAGVPELEAATDLGFAYFLRKVAAKYSIPFILEGHSFVSEGVTPLNVNYFDGRYIRSVHRQYGSLPMKTYPLMTLSRFLKSSVVDQPRFIRPLWYIDYSKQSARSTLTRRFDWSYYGGHHLENQMTAFFHSVYLPKKFGVDLRSNSIAAEVRAGLKPRDVALEELSRPIAGTALLERVFRSRLEITEEEYDAVMGAPPRHWSEFKTYKRTFELMKPLFRSLVKRELVPESFYVKYCTRSSNT